MEKLGPTDPERIGAYRLLARLGAGGMGQVFLARSDRGRTVAVKLVRRELAEQEEFRSRFRQEVQAARRVGGHWTAPVLDADTEAEVPWVATGYVAGPTLQQVVSGGHGPLPERSVLVLAAGLARALKDIHAAGLIHRDLKPSNVLVTIDGPRVIDFGIARALETVTDSGLTRTGALVGSPGFMAPEQIRGDRVTPACDVFCLGSVLAYAATGRLPFGTSHSGVHALMFRIAQEPPDLTDVPESLHDLIRDCLQKAPESRPALGRVLSCTGPAASPGEPWLPAALVAQLGAHAVQLLDLENPTTSLPPAGGWTPTVGAGTPVVAVPPVPPVPQGGGAPGVPGAPGGSGQPGGAGGSGAPGESLGGPLGGPSGGGVHSMPTMIVNHQPGGAPPGGSGAGGPGRGGAGQAAPDGPPAPGVPGAMPPHAPSGPAASPPASLPALPPTPPGSYGYGYPNASAPYGGYGYPQSGHDPYGHPTPPGSYGYPHPGGAPAPGPAPVPTRSRRSTVVLVLVAIVVALAAGGSVYAFMRGGSDEKPPAAIGTGTPSNNPSAQSSTSPTAPSSGTDTTPPPASTTPPASAGIPSGFLGTWRGTVGGDAGVSTRVLTLRQGGSGETVMSLVAEGPSPTGTYRCLFEAELASEPYPDGPLQLGPSRVVTGPAASCSPGRASEVVLLPDGRLRRTTPDNKSVTYTKSD
ncbi:serine/threonine-protein kinase [Streptomyces sp. NBC_00237]|uniref:serine/threonine-protein kinase n=1 Tax=Streptomyces sp. NBC_00237 TaxID=2975687 RepID=UPI002B1DE17E|nr:serine/threonine-protein kinase [Streptomyces sp. NBC_00237]